MKKIRIGVIPAAGRGTRISELPLTRILPKPMLPVLNRPIIEHVIKRMKKLGVEEVFIIVGYKKQVIRSYFGSGKDFGVKIKYVFQENPTGIADAIYLTEKYIKKPFVVILGDDFTVTKSLSNLKKRFFKKRAWAVTGVVRDNNAASLGRTNCVYMKKDGRIYKMIEKPTKPGTNVRGCGIYIFDPIVFEFIEKVPLSKRGLKEITDTLDLMAKKGKVYGAFIKGVNININTLTDLILAMNRALELYR